MSQNKEHHEVELSTSSRFYEFIFIFSEIVVLVLYATMTNYDEGVSTFDVSQDVA